MIPPSQGGEQIFLLIQLRRHARYEWGLLQVRQVDALIECAQTMQVDRAVDPIERILIQLEALEQEIRHTLGAMRGDLQPHREAEMPVRKLRLDRLEHAVDLLFIEAEVAVARDAELVATIDP